ncbi:acyl-CoA/acyl-ACP dehydrogenase [Schlegelella sp. S2-27]|uniref:Acyl-CoA/acyl-ACP dehydrogenase n=1 Tax=Caldimonas mangrovi TaxID=2944811 RepID=A0ABT0YMU7_9BURK|nr:acyl-CoA dehydrogenase family protein [Caldimonas mangrovi]MCM5680052.1 acyl-CoA/acyl-ACP dehydrogenase [Caldimonas mangrovi]
MNEFFSSELRRLVEQAESLAVDVIAPSAEKVDRDASWPRQSLAALSESRLTALTVPRAAGGHGQGLLAVAAITEAIGKACSSTSMCFGMHCVATAVLAAKATKRQEQAYLAPIAQGKHFTTLALSEAGTGASFFLSRTSLERQGENYVIDGHKQFVTSGGYADSYVISTQASGSREQGEFSCLVIDRDAPNLHWGHPWHGLGMRGNASRTLHLESTVVPADRLLGDEGDQVWYVFEIVAPYFLTAMAGTYLGIAQAALDLALQHMKGRRHVHSGQSLADIELLQHRVGQLWMSVEKCRLLLYHAARLGDLGDPQAMIALLASKAEAATTAVTATNEAMTLCGGAAYGENGMLARLLRDARAGHVMAPTTDMLTLWIGRSALGVPLF